MPISFAEPEWVHLLWAVLGFVLALGFLERRAVTLLERFVSGPLRSRLLVGPSRAQRLARLLLLAAVGAFATLALMRPQWGLELVESRRAGAEIMIALDVSRSMLAEDVAPNRLERSKTEIADLLGLIDGDQVGLIAFAGRASVLSPLTPDFGFLRLALDNAGPNSVGRGGTRLEEPIRKAVDGFGAAGDVSRSIILITDGEDHDSFPLEAAKEAADRGIRILAIGFGAETGADIPVTDPQTGARTLLRDAEGKVVRSRLDGDLLREMALITDGAYIPAGTGLLDLESIYERHIAPLTRGQLDGNTRAVRNEAFQWAVLLALLALVGAAMSTARPASLQAPGGNARGLTLVLAGAVTAAVAASPVPVFAQQAPALDPAEKASSTVEPAAAEGSEQSADTTTDPPKDPRSAYNEAVDLLEGGDPEAAMRLLEAARSEARTDGETRFRATYNLGWAEVRVADGLIESAPETALEHLHRAAGWFREAVDLRPGHEDARYNLEIVMRRALELADSLAARAPADLQRALDALIRDQRAFLAALRAGVAAQRAAAGAHATPELRRIYRGLAARELTVLTEAERASDQAARELETLRAQPADERSPEDALRAARLEAIVGHLHRARERAAQTRARLRKLQGTRAYRRAAAGLSAMQRARDQLLQPVARLDALLTDGAELAQLTGLKAAAKQGLEKSPTLTALPGWLSEQYLADSQTRLTARTEELHSELAAGLEADAREAIGSALAANDESAEQAALIERLREATPLIGTAKRSFQSADEALSARRTGDAVAQQREALEALASARERFLDLRRLIDLVYGEEQRVAAFIGPATGAEAGGPEAGDSEAPAVPDRAAIDRGAAVHERNVERAGRLGEMLSGAVAAAPAPEEADAGGSGQPTGGDGERARYERADELLRRARDAMHEVSGQFAEMQQAADTSALASARSSLEMAVAHLEELRRLFFDVLEHLKDTAERQQVLADETEALAALTAPDEEASAGRAGPLGHRQQRLAATAADISEALKGQAESFGSEDSTDGPAETANGERFSQAADLVAEARGTMQTAAEQLEHGPPDVDQARAAQEEALSSLAEAIALFQQGQPPEQDGGQEQSGGGSDEGSESEGETEADRGTGPTDLAQLLQGVRDREASRHEARARDLARRGYEPVEKDW